MHDLGSRRQRTERRIFITLFIGLMLAAALLPWSSHADSKGKSTGPKREKVIDFEDEVVEGMNKRPLDSLNQISEAERRKKKPHLYRKRVGYRTEIVQSIQELRYTQ